VGGLTQSILGSDVLNRCLTIFVGLGPKQVTQVVEVVVRGDRQRRGKVDQSGGGVVVVVEDTAVVDALKTARNREGSGIVDDFISRKDARLELGGRTDEFEGTARNVEALKRVVIERS